MGTPLYLAPEQARGEEADERSDLYSIGCMIYESLSGQPPIQAASYNALLMHIQNEAPKPIGVLRPGLDPEFAAVVGRALEKRASDRFQSAREMLDALQPWLPAIEPRIQMSVPPSAKVLGKLNLAHHLKTTRREGKR
jgi:serine/threonine-protein kinase